MDLENKLYPCLLNKNGNTTEIESKVCNTLKRKKLQIFFITKKAIAIHCRSYNLNFGKWLEVQRMT